MATKFTSLTKKKTAELHKKIRAEYLGYSSSEIEEEYTTLKDRYEELKEFSERVKADEQTSKQLRSSLRSAQSNVQHEKNRALASMGTLRALGTIFSSNPKYSDSHTSAVENARKASERYQKFTPVSYDSEIAERKALFHRLKVLSAIRKEHKAERLRALAQAKLDKVRNASGALKKRATKGLDSSEECPYCAELTPTNEMVLDHIYPVAEGGLGTSKNTVLVCWQCNSRKSDLTLRVFAKKFRLDYDAICERLDDMGKKF